MNHKINKQENTVAANARDYEKKLIEKVFKELDIQDFLPAYDRGDSKPYSLKPNKDSESIRKSKLITEKRRYNTTNPNINKDKKEVKQSDLEDQGDIKQNTLTAKVIGKKKNDDTKLTLLIPKDKIERKKEETKGIEDSKDKDKLSKTTTECNVKKVAERMKITVPVKREDRKKVDIDKYENEVKKNDVDSKERVRNFVKNQVRNSFQKVDSKLGNKNGDTKKQTDIEVIEKGKSNDYDTLKATDLEAKSIPAENSKATKRKEQTPVHRKPIIKTVKLKNDNRVYKAVTFVDQKISTPLHIKMPICKKEKQNIINTQNKPKKDKHRILKKRVSSPNMAKSYDAPPTEVAKWAPSCVSGQTKPYYEAWVDTTLAAITKCSKNDKLYLEKQNVLKTFKRVLDQRVQSPELMYEDFKDERYTGRITVRKSKVK